MSSTYLEPTIIKNSLFAPLDEDLHLVRIAGGNETEVYATDDERYVVKVKSNSEDGEEVTLAGTLVEAQAEAQHLKATAERIVHCIGPQHQIPNYFIVAQNDTGYCQPVVVQPYYRDAKALFDIDYKTLTRDEKCQLRNQLLDLIGRSVRTFFREGWMPDLYGRTSSSKSERTRLSGWTMLPWRLWSFLVQRNLLCSHNLMWTPDGRVILVDYDPMHQGQLYQWVYFHVRLALFVRDLVVLGVVLGNGQKSSVPPSR